MTFTGKVVLHRIRSKLSLDGREKLLGVVTIDLAENLIDLVLKAEHLRVGAHADLDLTGASNDKLEGFTLVSAN